MLKLKKVAFILYNVFTFRCLCPTPKHHIVWHLTLIGFYIVWPWSYISIINNLPLLFIERQHCAIFDIDRLSEFFSLGNSKSFLAFHIAWSYVLFNLAAFKTLPLRHGGLLRLCGLSHYVIFYLDGLNILMP